MVRPCPFAVHLRRHLTLDLFHTGHGHVKYGRDGGDTPGCNRSRDGSSGRCYDTVLEDHPGIAGFMDIDIAVCLQELVVFGGLGVDQSWISEQPDDPVQQSEGLQSFALEVHLIDGVLIAQNLHHSCIEDMQEGMGDPVVRVHEVGLVQNQAVQEVSE